MPFFFGTPCIHIGYLKNNQSWCVFFIAHLIFVSETPSQDQLFKTPIYWYNHTYFSYKKTLLMHVTCLSTGKLGRSLRQQICVHPVLWEGRCGVQWLHAWHHGEGAGHGGDWRWIWVWPEKDVCPAIGLLVLGCSLFNAHTHLWPQCLNVETYSYHVLTVVAKYLLFKKKVKRLIRWCIASMWSLNHFYSNVLFSVREIYLTIEMKPLSESLWNWLIIFWYWILFFHSLSVHAHRWLWAINGSDRFT